jgi:hypothetical protein
MRARYVLLAVGCLLTTAPQAVAQEAGEACDAVGKLVVGNWAEYEISGIPGQDVSSLRFAVVGEEASEGYWYEFKAATSQGPMIVQLLITGFPFEASDIKSMVVKPGSQPAMKLPAQALAMARQQMGPNPMIDFVEHCADAEFLGSESVTVPAGTFEAWHLESADNLGEAWISSEIPFGIVKGGAKSGEEMVLTGYGTDATSSITETPQEMPMMPGGPGNNRR